MGKYLDMIRSAEKTHGQTGQDKDPLQRQSYPVEAVPLVLGDRITWQRADGREQTGVIDFLHSSTGEVWAFCTLIDGGWTAVNVKYIDGEGRSNTEEETTR